MVRPVPSILCATLHSPCLACVLWAEQHMQNMLRTNFSVRSCRRVT